MAGVTPCPLKSLRMLAAILLCGIAQHLSGGFATAARIGTGVVVAPADSGNTNSLTAGGRHLTSGPSNVYEFEIKGGGISLTAEDYYYGGSLCIEAFFGEVKYGGSGSFSPNIVGLFFKFVTPYATYEIYSGYNNYYNKPSVKVDGGLNGEIKGDAFATKYSYGYTTYNVPVKFDLKLKSNSKNRYKIESEDSYYSAFNLAIANVEKKIEKSTIEKYDVEGTIWIENKEVVSTIKPWYSFYAKTKIFEKEIKTVSIFSN